MGRSVSDSSFFDGVPVDEALAVLGTLERRTFPPGAVMIAPGDMPREMYVIESGGADVALIDRQGGEHLVNRVGPGAPLGEMSLFTGHPASALVRTNAPTSVVVLREPAFLKMAEAFPRIYRNLGAILSERLVSSDRRSLRDRAPHVSLLRDRGAPPLLAYAITCSIAWHLRQPVLLLVDGGPPAVEALEMNGALRSAGEEGGLALFQPAGGSAFAAFVGVVDDAAQIAGERFTALLDRLQERFAHVLLFGRAFDCLAGVAGQSATLAGPQAASPFADSRFTLRGWRDNHGRIRPDVDGLLDVPALDAAATQELAGGALSLRTPAGRACGWAARDLTGMKVGLALGAGSAKGFAHIGVLRVLQQACIPVDYIAGSSIGAAVAALHARGDSEESIIGFLREASSALFRLALPTTSLLSSSGLRALARRTGGSTRFEALPQPLAIVAADLVHREEVIFQRGLVWPALLASISLPGIYPPQKHGHRLLVDGGVLNPVPSSIAAEMGASTVLAVRLSHRPVTGVPPVGTGGAQPRMSLIRTILNAIEAMQSKISATAVAGATIIIEPEFDGGPSGGLRDFRRGAEFVPLGEAAAIAALPRIAAALPWVRHTLNGSA
jgi:NTE family protein